MHDFVPPNKPYAVADVRFANGGDNAFVTQLLNKLDLTNYKKKILNCLISLNFNPNLCGTRYLLDCIVFSHENPYSCLNTTTLKKYFKQLKKSCQVLPFLS